MEYIKVRWRHDLPDEPIVLYSELDPERYETRKIEVYRDGRHDWADGSSSTGTTLLGELPIPATEEIAAQQEFRPALISQTEFEAVWQQARRRMSRED